MMTLSITTISIIGLSVTLGINNVNNIRKQTYPMLNSIMQSVIMLSVITPSVVMLNAVMLTVAAPEMWLE
jgi:hypothetical protein